MGNLVGSYKTISGVKQDVIEGRTFNGIYDAVFASGETEKLLLCEIPEDVTLQYLTQGLTLTPFDNTFHIRIMEDVSSITTGTTLPIIRNLNRGVSDIPLAKWTINPVGTYGGEGTVIEDFNVFERKRNYDIASKTLKDGMERIFNPSKHYLLRLMRNADTNPLTVEFRFVWIEF